jgi:hypothetical protein
VAGGRRRFFVTAAEPVGPSSTVEVFFGAPESCGVAGERRARGFLADVDVADAEFVGGA